MKKYLVVFLTVFVLISCDKKSKVEKAIEETPPVSLKVYRFDKAFLKLHQVNWQI